MKRVGAKITGCTGDGVGVSCDGFGVARSQCGTQRIKRGTLAVGESDEHPPETLELETEPFERPCDVDALEAWNVGRCCAGTRPGGGSAEDFGRAGNQRRSVCKSDFRSIGFVT